MERNKYKGIPIYPEVEVIKSSFPNSTITSLRISTHLRQMHEGKYYLQPIVESYHFQNNIEEDQLLKFIERFHIEVYKNKILYKVTPDTRMGADQRLFTPPDPYQESEEERIINRFLPHINNLNKQ
jgi:hypothetical protein